MIEKKYKLNNFSEGIETHEVFLDKLAKSREEEWGITEKRLEVPITERLSYFIFGIFFIFLITLFSWTFFLEVVKGEDYAFLSEQNRTRTQYERSERGVIYDSNLKQLVFNSPAFDLVCYTRELNITPYERNETIDKIAQLLGQNSDDIRKRIEEAKGPKALIAENIPHETLVLLETKISEFPGFEIEKNTVRDYINGSFYSQILGYMGKINKDEYRLFENYSVSDYIGRVGIEKSYEQTLRGVPGVTEIEKDSLGNVKGEKKVNDPKNGKSLVLYLDADLQKKLTEILEDRLKLLGLKKAAAVAMDPRTGGILAMVSTPTFDNNLISKGGTSEEFSNLFTDPAQPLFNRAINGQYPTGSTIKPLIASAALQEQIISPDKKIHDLGYIEVKSQYDSSVSYKYSGLEAPDDYDMRKAISDSANIYFYTIGGGYGDQEGLGPTLIKKYLELFGWGQKTSIDLPGESDGFLPSPEWKNKVKKESWWNGDTYHLAIGQGGLTATPLQVVSAFASIANGGILYQPQIVKEIVDTSSGKIQVTEKIMPKVLNQDFISSENLTVVREGMRQGVTSSTGTGRVLQSLPVSAASKTGTAQTGKDGVYDIWASVFAPYDNPEIVITVIVEDVEGLKVPALMVAKETLDWYFGQ